MSEKSRSTADQDVSVVICPDGPLLVRGPARIVSSDGREVVRNRRTVALCRCGKSGLIPWCDGTHKVIGFRDPVELGS
jgi:CDGSH-type Zn-finger protein